MVCIILAPGFEEMEALVPADLLRRAGLQVVLAGLKDHTVTGSHQITVQADALLSDLDPEKVELLFLPGGLGGVSAMSESPEARDFIRAVAQRQRYVTAICAAPTLLASLGLLEGRQAVCFPGMEEQLNGAVHCKGEPVVQDGMFLTGEAAGSAYSFGFRLIELLKGPETAQQIRDAIHYHG